MISALIYNNLSDNIETNKDRISIKKSKVTIEALADNLENQIISLQ